MSPNLSEWNALDSASAIATLKNCCASDRWAKALAAGRPYADEQALFDAANRIWDGMQVDDWMQAFRAHPRIGGRKVDEATAQSREWSGQEQARAQQADAELLADLAAGNRLYEEQFGFTYIICATNKSAEEMLSVLQRRLKNDREIELREAADQQRRITYIRLRKWLQI